jgi:hypothetical protein
MQKTQIKFADEAILYFEQIKLNKSGNFLRERLEALRLRLAHCTTGFSEWRRMNVL